MRTLKTLGIQAVILSLALSTGSCAAMKEVVQSFAGAITTPQSPPPAPPPPANTATPGTKPRVSQIANTILQLFGR